MSKKLQQASRKPTLPPNFAENVLQLELELECDCNVDKLHQLLELYTIAIEYYSTVRDPKYKQYQSRIQSLLKRGTVVQAMDEQKPSTEEPKNEQIKQDQESDIKRLQHSEMKFKMQISAESDAQKIVQKLQNSSITTTDAVKRNINLQERTTRDRLEKRKRQRSQTPECKHPRFSHRLSLGAMGDASAGMPMLADESAGKPRNPFEQPKLDYATELEKIMEKYIEAKVMKIQGIKTEWLPKIEAVSAEQNEHSIHIADCMLQNMQEEIARITRENEEEKSKEISLLKSQLM